jgi:ribonuclease-3
VIPLRKPDDLLGWVERSFGHVFAAPALCQIALTHRSAGTDHNERLEFLGDSILNCAVAHLLYDAHPQADEGALSRLRASLVSGETLAQIAGDLGLGEHLRLGPGELKSGGFRRASILADALEAVLGAIFLDSGFDAAAAAVARILGARISDLPAADALKDPRLDCRKCCRREGWRCRSTH